MNIDAINSSASPLCEICESIEHLTLNCQVGTPFPKTQVKSIMLITSNRDRPMIDILILITRIGGIMHIFLIGLTLILLVYLK